MLKVTSVSQLIILAMLVCMSCASALNAEVAQAQRICLTAEERAWLDQNPEKLTLLFNIEFPPIEFASPSGAFTGMGADIIALVEQRLGITFSKSPSDDWNEHLAALESGACAVAPTIVATPERRKFSFFTPPYAVVPVVIITSQAVSGRMNLEDFYGRRVAVVSGYATESYVRDRSQKRFEVVPVSNVSAGLRAVSFGHVDALVENLAVASYFIDKEGIPNLRVAGDIDFSFAWSIGVSRHYPLLFSAVQKALETIPESEIKAVQNRWISLDVGGWLAPETRRLLLLIAVFTVLLLVSLAGISLILKRRLDEKVASLKSAQRELLEQAEFLRMATGAIQAGVWDFRPGGQTIYCSGQWWMMLGYEPQERQIPLAEYRTFIHPDDLSASDSLAKDYDSRGGQGGGVAEFRLRQADGGWCWVLSKGKTVEWDKDGKPVRVIGLDINNQTLKQAQEEISRSEARFRALFMDAPIPLANLSLDGRIIAVNASFSRMLDYTLEDLPDLEHWWRLAYPDPDYRNQAISTWQAAISRARLHDLEVEPAEFHVTCKNGTILTMIISAKLMGDSIIISFSDITEQKQAQATMDFERRQLLSIFDSLNVIIYVSDPFTYEILFANRRLQDLIGKDPTGGLCYRDLQGYDQPCEFCTNTAILANGGKPYRWEYHNPVTNVDVDIVDQIIRWPDGRDVRLEIAFDITERKRAEEALWNSERKLRSIFEAMTDVIMILDAQGRYKEIAPTNTALMYRTPEEMLGKTVREVFPTDKADLFLGAIGSVLAERRPVSLQYELMIGERQVWFETTVSPLTAELVICVARDISERKRAEAEHEKLQDQLLQSQKLEAVGILAGGVAHDFNNMLGAIIGYAELTMGAMDPANPLRKNLERILDAAQRSASLTRQLLAFARKQTIAPVVFDLNEAVESLLKMVRRLIGENIELAWLPGTVSCTVSMDTSQFDQLLVNLCVNARDAILDVGRISIESDVEIFNEAYCESHAGVAPGEYAVLTVSDDGCGMDEETLEHIFEPFFTTKGLGQGTGMGLATVYGIVKQNGGFISVASQPRKGTSFKVYIPCFRGEALTAEVRRSEDIPRCRGETILVVEDDPILLKMSKRMLQQLGYTVIPARTPSEAIRIVRESGLNIKLCITDVIMPEMNGRDLVARMKALRPEMKHLFMSGYTADVIAHQGVLDKDVHFIPKPFTIRDLATEVRNVLG